MKLVRLTLVLSLAGALVACGGATPAPQAPTGNEVGTTTITSALGTVPNEDATPKVGKPTRAKRATEDLFEPKRVTREGKKSFGFGAK